MRNVAKVHVIRTEKTVAGEFNLPSNLKNKIFAELYFANKKFNV